MAPTQRLYELDKSSTQFPEQLDELLHDTEWVKCLELLPEGELMELIGYLDNVRPISTRTRSRSSSPQILDGLDRTGLPFGECLHALRKVCRSRMVLPSTYELYSPLLFGTMEMVASGGFSDVFKGSLGASDVCIKRLWTSVAEDRAMVIQVSYPHKLWRACHLLTNFGGALSGSGDVEVPQSPEHCAVQGYYL